MVFVVKTKAIRTKTLNNTNCLLIKRKPIFFQTDDFKSLTYEFNKHDCLLHYF